ncbi:MAG: hypothetical protein A2084_01585 [Tenericutes bacterium GWC2_39_45]|nr:MAG: hypothetical protein A2084_01585 [Tenericutes bacterium GWC2_39_45]HBG32716.1 hypothetical protein [Acholeplasmataceae bacterium]HCB67084.1 hypothetical protein [Acholeplasmataceae bacterium]
MKKLLFLMVIFSVLLMSCTEPEVPSEVVTYTVTFNSDGGTAVTSLTVDENALVTEPADPTKEGYVFEYWYVTDSEVEYDFTTPVTANITLTASWILDVPSELTDAEKIQLDITDVETLMFVDAYQLSLPIRGRVSRSTIKWTSSSNYISSTGYIIPIPATETATTGQITGEFTLNGVKVTRTYDIPLAPMSEVDISVTRSVPFENLTTEYTVADGDVNLYFEEDGSVPYIKLVDFFALLEGFIDPEVELTFTKGEGTLEIFYQYYDEDEDITYDLILTVNADDNTIITNDPGFYWAYVYSTETNYGRHITYDNDNPNNHSVEGSDVVYDLDLYNMDIAVYEGDVVLPYYIVNQLFAGSSYYNVYYNNDGLFGIYSLPSEGSLEYRTIKESSMNDEKMPADLLVHTFNMLAFNLDYFYGLKDIMEVETYYDLLYAQRNKLLTNDPEDFDYALRDLLLKSIDEPHTSYGYPSYFNESDWAGPEQNDLKYYGDRFKSWYYDGYVAVDAVIGAKWGEAATGWNASSSGRPHYWFLDDVTVMLNLDDFNTADIEESATYDATLANAVLEAPDISLVLPAINSGSKYFYYNNSDENRNKLEVLVKGLTAADLTTYGNALVALGYTFVLETTTNLAKANGYYQLVIPADGTNAEQSYMVQIAYNEAMKLFYVGIINSIPLSFAGVWPFTVNIDEIVYSDSAVYMEMMMDQIILAAPTLENIILDISWNTGGNVGALYRIVGFITDQPFAVSGIDGDTGGMSTSHVLIEGVPSYAHLNWALLITPVSFSAANSLATIFMANDLGPIVGKTSGGGACSITPILLPNGTAFTMSSNNINAYRTGTGTEEDPFVYHNNEFGITPDFAIDINLIYNVETLLTVFN